MGRLDPDMGNAQVVAPGAASDPFTSPSAQTADPASAPAGPDAAPAGPPGEATPSPDPTPAPTPDPAATAAPAAPPAPPPAPTPAAPGPAPVPETVDPPPTTPAPLTAEDVERARLAAVEETEAKWRNRQSGQDRQMNAMEARIKASEAATEEQRQLTRESLLNKEGLTDAERASLQRTWDQDDRERKLNEFSSSTLDLHADTEIALLLIDYREIPGVTAEVLGGMAQEEREGFCKDQKIAHLEGGGAPAAAATNGAAQPAPAPAATPPPAAPAGASAPSDIGGGGPPPAATPRNENPGTDAMAENIAGRGWVEKTISTRPGRS